jgi:hypothetical protein
MEVERACLSSNRLPFVTSRNASGQVDWLAMRTRN